MTCSPYLKHVRDLAVIERIVRDYERAKGLSPQVKRLSKVSSTWTTVTPVAAFDARQQSGLGTRQPRL